MACQGRIWIWCFFHFPWTNLFLCSNMNAFANKMFWVVLRTFIAAYVSVSFILNAFSNMWKNEWEEFYYDRFVRKPWMRHQHASHLYCMHVRWQYSNCWKQDDFNGLFIEQYFESWIIYHIILKELLGFLGRCLWYYLKLKFSIWWQWSDEWWSWWAYDWWWYLNA